MIKPSGNPVLGDKLLPSETDACSASLSLSLLTPLSFTCDRIFDSWFSDNCRVGVAWGEKSTKPSTVLPKDLVFWSVIKGTRGSLSASEADAGKSIFSMRETAVH